MFFFVVDELKSADLQRVSEIMAATFEERRAWIHGGLPGPTIAEILRHYKVFITQPEQVCDLYCPLPYG